MQAIRKLSQTFKRGRGNLLSKHLLQSLVPVEHVYSCAQVNSLNHGRQNSAKHVHQNNIGQGYLGVA